MEETFNELKSICTDALSSRPPDLAEFRNNLITILDHNSEKIDKFYAHEEKWAKDKTSEEKFDIIFKNIQSANREEMYQLAGHFHCWFEDHSRFKDREEVKIFGSTPYDANMFISFIKILDYGQLRRCLEEAIADEFSEDTIISLMS